MPYTGRVFQALQPLPCSIFQFEGKASQQFYLMPFVHKRLVVAADLPEKKVAITLAEHLQLKGSTGIVKHQGRKALYGAFHS